MKVQMSSGVTALPARLPLGGVAAGAAGGQLLERDRVLAGAGHPDHVLEQRQLVADRADLLQLLVVLDDDDLGVGVLEHVLALLGGVGLVDRDDDGADRERREVEVGPLGAGVGEDRDLVALGDAEVDQAERASGPSPAPREAAVDPLPPSLKRIAGACRRARRPRQQVREGGRFGSPPHRGESSSARAGASSARLAPDRQAAQRGLEEGLVDPAVEDRNPHLHAFADHLLPFHVQLVGKLGGVR